MADVKKYKDLQEEAFEKKLKKDKNEQDIILVGLMTAVVTVLNPGVVGFLLGLSTGVGMLGLKEIGSVALDTIVSVAEDYPLEEGSFSRIAKGVMLSIVGFQVVGGICDLANKNQEKAALKASQENTQELERRKKSSLPEKGKLKTSFTMPSKDGEQQVFVIENPNKNYAFLNNSSFTS